MHSKEHTLVINFAWQKHTLNILPSLPSGIVYGMAIWIAGVIIGGGIEAAKR